MVEPVIWHKQPKVLQELIDQAEDVIARFPNADLLGIGQSPAWLLKVACMIEKKRGLNCRSNIIPFSSHFIEKKEDGNFNENTVRDDQGRIVKEFHIDRPKNVYLYRKRLKARAQDPKSIINNFKRGGRPTVIMDYVKNGRGLASFMHMMCSWAQEQGDDILKDFLEATRVHALVEYGGMDVMRFPDINVAIPVSLRKVSDNFTYYFADAPNTAPDRLVQYYPPEDWHAKPKAKVNREFTSAVGGKVGEAVCKHLGLEPDCFMPVRRNPPKPAKAASPSPTAPH